MMAYGKSGLLITNGLPLEPSVSIFPVRNYQFLLSHYYSNVVKLMFNVKYLF